MSMVTVSGIYAEVVGNKIVYDFKRGSLVASATVIQSSRLTRSWFTLSALQQRAFSEAHDAFRKKFGELPDIENVSVIYAIEGNKVICEILVPRGR